MRDFAIKMQKGEISGYQAYYEYANNKSVDFSCKVAELRAVLKNIEDSENAIDKPLQPLKSMYETLMEYMALTDT